MATIREIARKSGYSPATVSRLLNDDPTFSITPEARNKILKTARSLGYSQQFSKRNFYHIGVIFSVTPQQEIEDIYFNELRHSLISSSKQTNFELTFLDNLDKIKSFDGLFAVGNFSNEELHLIKNTGVKCVFIDSNPNPRYFTSVQPNLKNIIETAIDILLENNITKIGYAGGTSWNARKKDVRELSFENYLSELGLLDSKYIFIGKSFKAEEGYRLGKRIAATQLPEALIVGSDSLAIGILQALNEKNIDIPNKIKIISINDINIAQYTSPSLTTFHIDLNEMGKVATETLLEMLINEHFSNRQILLNAFPIFRDSFSPHKK